MAVGWFRIMFIKSMYLSIAVPEGIAMCSVRLRPTFYSHATNFAWSFAGVSLSRKQNERANWALKQSFK